MTTQELLDAAAWIYHNRPDVWDKVAMQQHPAPERCPPVRLYESQRISASYAISREVALGRGAFDHVGMAQERLNRDVGQKLLEEILHDGRTYGIQAAQETRRDFILQADVIILNVDYKDITTKVPLPDPLAVYPDGDRKC